MSLLSRMLRPITLGATAAAGLVGAHVLDYLVIIPANTTRRHTLATTGHGYLSEAVVLSIAAGIVALISMAVLGYRRGSSGSDDAPTFRWLATRLALLQVVAFLLLELGERVLAGVPLEHAAGPLIGAGLILQVAFGVIAAGLLVLLGTAAEAIGAGRAVRGVARSSPRRGLAPMDVRLVQTLFSRPGAVRAPPTTLVRQP